MRWSLKKVWWNGAWIGHIYDNTQHSGYLILLACFEKMEKKIKKKTTQNEKTLNYNLYKSKLSNEETTQDMVHLVAQPTILIKWLITRLFQKRQLTIIWLNNSMSDQEVQDNYSTVWLKFSWSYHFLDLFLKVDKTEWKTRTYSLNITVPTFHKPE